MSDVANATPDPVALAALIATIDAALGRTQHAVFRVGAGTASAPGATTRVRTLVAFATPDAALAFAQYNSLGQARTRTLATGPLLLAALRDTRITALLLAADELPTTRGALPVGIHLARAELVRRLQIAADPTTEQEIAS